MQRLVPRTIDHSGNCVKEPESCKIEGKWFWCEPGDAKVKKNPHMLLDPANEGDTIITLEVSLSSINTQQWCEIVDSIRGNTCG